MDIAILILAAGASSRMGDRDKLLEAVEGTPLLRRITQQAINTGNRVAVALRPDDAPRKQALGGMDILIVSVPDAATGMSASIRCGVKSLTDAQAIMIQPADMPDLTTMDFDLLCSEFARSGATPIVRARDADGRPGHPVLFPAEFFPALQALKGDKGASEILRQHADRVQYVELQDHRATTDLDTTQDWEQWQQSRRSVEK